MTGSPNLTGRSYLSARIAVALLSVSLTIWPGFSAPIRAQPADDTIQLRSGGRQTGRVLSIDATNVLLELGPVPRADIEWIAFGAAEPPRPFSDADSSDRAWISGPTLITGRLLTLDREKMEFLGPEARIIPFSDVAAVALCDAPCGLAEADIPSVDPALPG
jgi:hypothetical protein